MKRNETRPLRARHVETTKTVILEAAIDLLVERGAFDFGYHELARRAGVAVPTVYRHYKTRDVLFETLSRQVNEVINLREIPRTREGVAATVRAMFPRFDQHERLIRAQLTAGSTGARQARHKRVGLLDRVIADALPHLPVERRRAVAGLFACLLSASIWQRLRDEAGLDGTRAGEVTSWAVDTLWRALEQESRAAK